MDSMDQHGDGKLSWVDGIGSEQSDDWMSEQSYLMSIMIMAQRAGMERNVAWRGDASCSCVNMGQGLVGFMLE